MKSISQEAVISAIKAMPRDDALLVVCRMTIAMCDAVLKMGDRDPDGKIKHQREVQQALERMDAWNPKTGLFWVQETIKILGEVAPDLKVAILTDDDIG